jgi:hypothetical protein
MTEDKTYNGWTNYETWAVNLWLDEEDNWRELAGDGSCQAAQALQELVEEMNPLADQATMYSDLLTGVLQEVNWQEIVEAHQYD